MKENEELPHVLTKSAFAKFVGVNPSTVTRWKQTGRIVLAPNGKVKVKDSLAQIKATEGHRSDLKTKHSLVRGKEIKVAQIEPDLSKTEELPEMLTTEAEIGKDRAHYQAITLSMKNNSIKLKKALKDGKRVEKAQLQSQLAQLGKQLKQGIERSIDNLAPLLVKADNRAEQIQQTLAELGEQA